MKTKFALLTFCLFSLCRFCFSQQKHEDIISRVNESPFIFEGSVIRDDSYFSSDGRTIYTSHTIEIYKILKGADLNLVCGTIELITLGGIVGDRELEVSHNLVLRRGMTGVFLCDENSRWELPTTDYYHEDNTLVMWCPYGLEGFIRYFNDGINYAVVDWQFSLDSLAHVYDMLDLFTTLTLVDCGGVIPPFNPKGNLPILSAPTYPNIPIPNIPVNISSSINSSRINYHLVNRHITSTVPRYFEFDIMIDDDVDPGYLHSADMVITYPVNIFGSNIVGVSHLILSSVGAMANTNAYILNPYDVPSHSDKFAIQIRPDSTSTNSLVNLPDVATEMLHVRMEIIDCNSSGVLQMPSPAGLITSQNAWFSSSTYNSSPPTSYDIKDYASPIYFPSCDMHIDAILSSHMPIRGGTDDTVTITGMNFDTTRGTGNIWLRNANDNTSFLPLDSSDYVLWNDTVIKFTMPGVIENSAYFINNQYGIPGSGKFKVQNSVGDTAHGDSITVRFSVNEQWSTLFFKKEDFRLVKAPGSPTDGYQFRYDTAFSKTLHPDRYTALDVGIKQWGCLNGVNFTLGDSIIAPQDSTLEDGINIIQFGKGPALNVIGFAKLYKTHACGYKVVTEIDIVFNEDDKDSTIFNTDCGDTIPAGYNDGYAILLHELGHAHCLNHINDKERIMYWAQRPHNVILPGNERNVYIRYDMTCDEGSAYEMSNSADPGLMSCSLIDEMVPYVLLQCDTLPMRLASPLSGSNGINFFCPHISVNELENVFSDLNLYPNPVHNTINMNFNSEKLLSGNVMIYDMYGRKILTQYFKSTYGKNSFQIDVEGLSNGIYNIGVVTERGNMFYKFIKE